MIKKRTTDEPVVVEEIYANQDRCLCTHIHIRRTDISKETKAKKRITEESYKRAGQEDN